MNDSSGPKWGLSIRNFLTRRRSRNGFDVTDILAYAFLLLGVLVMFVPVLWVVLSSFKTSGDLEEFPPTFLPYKSETVMIEGYAEPLRLFEVTQEDGSTERLAQIRRVGLNAQMIDPENPEAGPIVVEIANARPIRHVGFTAENYANLMATTGAISLATFSTVCSLP